MSHDDIVARIAESRQRGTQDAYIYHMLKTRESYDESVFARAESRHRQRTENRLRALAQNLGYTLTPAHS
jgi:molybdopterin synthase catalytic subunit